MQPKEMFCVLPFVLSFSIAAGIQYGSMQTQFLPHVQLSVLGTIGEDLQVSQNVEQAAFAEVVEEGITHLRNSWSTSFAHVKEEKSNVDDIPTRRKLMYFRPVSVTLQCVMLLTITSMLVHTCLSIARNTDELSATFTPSAVTQMLTIGSRVAALAPMLCLLFVACRMYVLATTEGLGEPPNWVKSCMWIVVSGMILQLVVVLLLPAFTKKHALDEASYDMTEGKKSRSLTRSRRNTAAWQMAAWEATRDDTQPPTDAEVAEDVEGGATQAVQDATGEQNDVHPELNSIELKKGAAQMYGHFWFAQILSMFCIYGGITGVIVGIFTFPAQTTKVSPPILCTVILSVLYFAVCFLLWIARTIAEPDSALVNGALSMSTAIRKVPMFAVLFLASRMRALQLNPPSGMPPFWLSGCFSAITALVYLEAFAAAYVGGNGEKAKGYYGVYLFQCASKSAQLARHAFALASYALLIPIFSGCIHMGSASGAPAPLSITMKCVLILGAVYFCVMLAQDAVLAAAAENERKREAAEAAAEAAPFSGAAEAAAALLVEECEAKETKLIMLRDTAISAGISLGLAPVLCVLFVATRMRALQITQQLGSPPGWAQDCMLIAVFATCVQSVCCLVMPVFVGSACKVDEDGDADYDLKPMVGAFAVAVVKYAALIALHGSVIAICVSIFVMTPETANSSGRFITGTKHLFEGLAITLLVFCLALLFSSAKVVGLAVKFVIESAELEELLGVKVTVKKVALNIFRGYIHVRKLQLHQPKEEIVYAKNAEGKLVGTLTGNKCEWNEAYIGRVELIEIKINLWRLVTSMAQEFELEELELTGLHVNVEKPNADINAKNTNLEYILNHLEAEGDLSPTEDTDDSVVAGSMQEPKKEKPADSDKPKEDCIPWAQQKMEKIGKKMQTCLLKEDAEAELAEEDHTRVIIHKIKVGDIGVGVRISGVKFIGEISFHPTMGLIEFTDVQKQVFGGRDNLKSGEMVACIIRALARHVFNSSVKEIPRQIARSATEAASKCSDGMKTSVDKALKKLPCKSLKD